MASKKRSKPGKKFQTTAPRTLKALDIDATLQQAVLYHQADKLDKAAPLYRKILLREPTHYDALQLLGAIHLAHGRHGDALELINRALAVNEGLPALHSNAGMALRSLGRYAEAEAAFKRALQLQSDFLQAHFNLGLALIDQQRYADALPHLSKANGLRPGHLPTLQAMVRAYRELSMFEQAITVQSELCQRADNIQAPLRQLASLLESAQRYAEQAEVYQRLRSLQPDDLELAAELAKALEASGQLDAAKTVVTEVLATDPRQLLCGVIAMRLARRRKAYDASVALAKRLEQVVAPPELLAGLHNEKGLSLDRLGHYDAAFEAFATANRLVASSAGARAVDAQTTPDMLSAYSHWARHAELPPAASTGLRSPVFFCGFPRSGTTLMEQILDAHPQVVCADERPVLSQIAMSLNKLPEGAVAPFPEGLADLDERTLEQLRQHYWSQHELHLGEPLGERLLVDKMPLNLWFLPMALRLFPDARVLVALRDPRDCILSCYMQLFEPNESMIHFLTLEGSARFYAQTMTLWQIYHQRLRFAAHSYRYEDLVGAFKPTVDAVLRFLDLDWVDDLEVYHQREVAKGISTPSYIDASSPIYGRAVGRWQHYRSQMESVLPLLDPFVGAFGYPES